MTELAKLIQTIRTDGCWARGAHVLEICAWVESLAAGLRLSDWQHRAICTD